MDQTLYWPDKQQPIVGGYSATFSQTSRNVGKRWAIAATQRVVLREPYYPTGDEAFDIRSKAFREVLLAETPEAFEESHEAFASIAL
jgi:hypothetical protein